MSNASYNEYVRRYGERAYHIPPDAEFLKRARGYIRSGEIYVEFTVRGILYHTHRKESEYYKGANGYQHGFHDVLFVPWPGLDHYRGL